MGQDVRLAHDGADSCHITLLMIVIENCPGLPAGAKKNSVV